MIYAPFLRDYLEIRREEARGSDDPAYYKALPEVPAADPLAWQWHIRTRSYRAFVSRVLARRGPGLRVVDCGGGCGWLSHRLHTLGHHPCCVDVNDDPQDGLRAARHYAPTWPVVRGEFDALPLGDACADLVVYNGAFHYSADYAATLREALRVLRPGGTIVLLDTPLYHRAESGPAMVRARHAAYRARKGHDFASPGSVEFLHVDALHTLGTQVGLRFQILPVWYGWRWHLARGKARLLGPREQARFALVLAEKAHT